MSANKPVTEIYVAPEVQAVRSLYPYLHDIDFKRASIRDQVQRQADTLLDFHQSGDARIAMQVKSWWPLAQGRPIEDILVNEFSREDARLTLAREYGFESWEQVSKLGDMKTDSKFEGALDAMLSGDLASLEKQLTQTPSLASKHTRYGHQSTLLHYIGANGVESHRQCTPASAVESARLLIHHGADISAKANMYGGNVTPHMLASTSKHPNEAGIAAELCRLLEYEPF